MRQIDYSFILFSISLDILKINRIRIAQIEAPMPIKAYILSPSKKWEISSRLMLNNSKADAKKIKIVVKIFINKKLVVKDWWK